MKSDLENRDPSKTIDIKQTNKRQPTNQHTKKPKTKQKNNTNEERTYFKIQVRFMHNIDSFELFRNISLLLVRLKHLPPA